MQELNDYIDRIQAAHTRTMRKLGPELQDGLDSNLTSPQFFILYMLSKKDKWMVTELAERLSVKPSAVTVMIDRLHQQGFVERKRDDRDRRVVFVNITEQGRQTLATVADKRKQVIHKYLQQLSKEELESLVHIYEKMARIVTGE